MSTMGMMHSKWWKEKPATKNTLPSNVFIQIWRRDKDFYRQIKAKMDKIHYTDFISNGKGTLSREKKKDRNKKKKTATKMGKLWMRNIIGKKKKKIYIYIYM